ncbi:hypothetical protein GH714_033172 [Hevea brasiliensis]|uniref:Formin-like protein n=1 Tax=Hevea brasiliensis TaxID=3981 RepID=A0A6A6L4H7_HEVBR|nr:hypothetical protein GH714_033172 [Hevea brasiliensis]
MGTVQPGRTSGELNGTTNEANVSPYRKLNSIKTSDRYRPSPDLQPLPPLPRPPSHHDIDNENSPSSSVSSSDEESHGTAFYTPQGSSISNDDGFYTPAAVSASRPVSNSTWAKPANGRSVPHSKRTSPKSRLSSISSPEMKHVIIPSIKQPLPSQVPPNPPPCPALTQEDRAENIEPRSSEKAKTSVSSTPATVSLKQPAWPPSPRTISKTGTPRFIEQVDRVISSSEKTDAEEQDGAKPKLKPLHWDKVRATSDRATVWDQLKSSSFQLNEDMMESLFGCNSTNSVPKEPTRRSVLPPVVQENRVLDPKKSQNIAILLRALNVTREEVSEALLDGNPESLGAELLETLVKMAPTKEEEIKLREYSGDSSKLGSAERFLKAVLDIPFAFRRVEAMLYRANFDTEVIYLRKSFQTLEEIIRSEGAGTDSTNENPQESTHSKFREDDFTKQGLQVVSGLSRDLSNVKKAAGMDSDVLSSYVSKLEMGLEKVRSVLQYEKLDMQGKFFNSMKLFLREAEGEITRIKAEERKALSHVKEVTEYFHGDAAKEEAHPLRIFMIVRDFLTILDHVCKEVGKMQDKTMIGSARSFRISATASLPVLNRYNVRQDRSSDEESSSP